MHVALVVVVLLRLPAVLTTAPLCASDIDCHLNGVCVGGDCWCDPSWAGTTCGRLNLQPVNPAQMGYVKRNVTSWGGNAIRGDDDKWHMFVSEIPDGCSLNYWNPNSQVIHATADSPAGPYTKVAVALPSWAHEPQLIEQRSKGPNRFVLFHVGLGNHTPGPVKCGPPTPPAPPPAPPPASLGSTVHTSASLDGPWRPVLGPFSSSSQPCTNPAPFLHSNGTWYLRCIGGDMHRAPSGVRTLT